MIDPLAVIRPVWVVTVAFGGTLAALSAVVWPPRLSRYPGTLAAGIVGAILGQAVVNEAGLTDPMVGDAHILGILAGAALAVAVVRRLVP